MRGARRNIALLTLGALTALSVILPAQALLISPQHSTVEKAGVKGHVTAEQFRPTRPGDCNPTAIVEAQLRYGISKAGMQNLLAALQPREAQACIKLAHVQGPNVLTTAFKNLIRDCLAANTGSACSTIDDYKYHGLGTNNTAATAADTGCGTEATTQYNPDSTRATGSQTTNGAGIYRTVGTNTVDASLAVVEWCLNTASSGAGNLASHIIFSTINLSSGDSLQTTWDLTIS